MPKLGRRISVILAFTLLMGLSCLIAVARGYNAISPLEGAALRATFIAGFLFAGTLLCSKITKQERNISRRRLLLTSIFGSAIILTTEAMLVKFCNILMGYVGYGKGWGLAAAFLLSAFSVIIAFSVKYIVFAKVFERSYGNYKLEKTWLWLCILTASLLVLFSSLVGIVKTQRVIHPSDDIMTFYGFIDLIARARYDSLLNGVLDCAPMMAFAMLLSEQPPEEGSEVSPIIPV